MRYIRLSCLAFGMLGAANDAPSRFDPPFPNDLHAPRTEDAQIIRILKNYKDHHLGAPRSFSVVHGNFLGRGAETVVVAAAWQLPEGASPAVFLFVKGARGWQLESHYGSLNAAYCRVISVSSNKDILLCQSDYVGPARRYGQGEVDTDLYAVDFTREPVDSEVLHLRDTVTTGSGCLSWASVKSVEFRNGSLHVLVDYGRKSIADRGAREELRSRAIQAQGSPAGFAHQLYDIEFRLREQALAPVEQQVIDYVKAPWEAGRGRSCAVPE